MTRVGTQCVSAFSVLSLLVCASVLSQWKWEKRHVIAPQELDFPPVVHLTAWEAILTLRDHLNIFFY